MTNPYFLENMRRELDAMSRPLDAEVHQVVFYRCPHPKEDTLRFSKAKRLPAGALMCSRCGADPAAQGEWMPCYSGTSGAIDYVVPAMADRGFSLVLSQRSFSGENRWEAQFNTHQAQWGPTPGVAICRAAVAAMGSIR